MAKRMILMLVVAVAVIAGLGFVKFRQIQTAVAQGASFAPPPEAVTTVVAKPEKWPSTSESDWNRCGSAGCDGQRRSSGNRRSH